MKHFLLVTSLCLALSSCYAQRMELVDPMVFSVDPPQIHVSIQSDTNPDFAYKLQQHLTRLLPRERGLDVIEGPSDDAWTLQLQLSRKQLLAEAPAFLLTGQQAASRMHLQYDLAMDLVSPDKQVQTHWDFTQRGDAQVDAVSQLEHELLDRLVARALQSLQPRYDYF